MKDTVRWITLCCLGFFLGILGCISFWPKEIIVDKTYTITGEIIEFDKGNNSTRHSRPMSIILEDKQYNIYKGLRWAIDDDRLIEILKPGNMVELEYITNDDDLFVLGIKYNNEVVVTVEDSINGQIRYQKSSCYMGGFTAYTCFLLGIGFIVTSLKRFNLDYDLGFSNKVYLSISQILINIIICILLGIGTLLITTVNKWLFIPFVTITIFYIFWSKVSVKKLYFGRGGFLVIKYTKRTHYGWNAVKEYSRIKSYKGYKVSICFKNEQTYIFKIKNNYISKFNNYVNKYYLKKKRG